MMRAAELYGESLYDLAAEEKQEQDILTEMQDIERYCGKIRSMPHCSPSRASRRRSA